MKISKEIILLLLSIFVTLFILEIIFRSIQVKLPNNSYSGKLYQNYSKQELNDNLSFRHPNHGGECIKRKNKKMFWNPRFGSQKKILDIDCLERLFAENKTNIIFMGGSGMANDETPNYLTSIEHYMFKGDDEYRSINLAEAGARLSNELSIFIEYIPKLKNKPDFIIFFDGYNEFSSIRYNGSPDNDFYWTVGVERRIHKPFMYYFDLIIERSALLKIIFNNIYFFNSNRLSAQKIEKSKIISSAKDYIYRKKIIEKLCKVYSIKKCIFVLQPVFVLSQKLNGDTDILIQEWHDKYFKNDRAVYELGYNYLISNVKNIYNLVDIFDNQSNIYLDYVHTNKVGSKIIGEELMKILKKEIDSEIF